jgi:hypothetical protein
MEMHQTALGMHLPSHFQPIPSRKESSDSFLKFPLQGKASFDAFPDLLESQSEKALFVFIEYFR